MSNKIDWLFRIHDILFSIEQIEMSAADHQNAESFYEDWESFRAAERNFQIIGEAVKIIPKDIKLKYTDMEWQNIIDMRNLVVHEYVKVDPNVFWRAIQEDIPALKSLIEQMKADHD